MISQGLAPTIDVFHIKGNAIYLPIYRYLLLETKIWTSKYKL